MKTRCWGCWWIDDHPPVSLNIQVPGGGEYWVELQRCRSERARRNWLEHMRAKQWISLKDLLDLRRAFDDLFPKRGNQS